MKLWRHVHTRSPGGELGRPGFQTVARAEALDEAQRKALDKLAGQAIRCHGGTPGPTFFLQPAMDAAHCVLTRVDALPESFDQRPGNHWVESQVVPMGWLQGMAWNLPAAFDALDWWGAQRGEQEIEDRAVRPALLPAEDLPATESSPRHLPGRIVDLVPDREIRHGILAVFARQAVSAGQPVEPLYVGDMDEDGLVQVRELLLLLALAFPLAWRTRSDEDTGQPRCLRLATLGAPGHLPNRDLMGLKPSVLDQLRSRHEVFDLSGSVPPPRLPDGEPADIARRIDEALRDGDGERLADLHRDLDPSHPSEERPTSMASDDEFFDPAPDLPTPRTGATADLKQRKEREWARREADEAEAGGVVRQVSEEQKGLVEDLTTLIRRQREQLRKEADRLHTELDDTALELRRDLEERTRKLKSEQQNALLNEEKELKDRIRKWTDRSKAEGERLGDELKAEHDKAMAALKERFDEASRALEESHAEKMDELSRKGGLPPDKRTAKKGKTGGPAGGLFSRLRGRPGLIALVVALVIVASATVGWMVLGAGQDEEGSRNDPELTDPQDQDAGGEGSGDPLQVDPSEARRLLTTAVASGNPQLRERAAQAWVLVAMDGTEALTLDRDASCTVTQALVRETQIARGLDPLNIDGQCGAGTAAAVGEVAGPECAAGSWNEQAACLWTRKLAPGRQECQASWPLVLTCDWRLESAREFLALLRRAATSANRDDLRRRYDLVANGELAGQLPPLDPSDGEDLLPLARLLALADEGPLPAGTPWRMPQDDELPRIQRYLEGLQAEEGPGGVGEAPRSEATGT